MNPSSSAKRKFYLSIGLLLLLVITLCFSSWYVFGLIKEEGQKIKNIQSEMVALNKQRTRIAEMLKEYERASEIAAQLDKTLLSSSEKLDFILLVESLARDTNVEHLLDIANIDPETISFNISVSGSFNNMLRFIYFLENSRYYVSVRKINIAKGGEKNGLNIVRAQMLAKVFTRSYK